MPALGGVVGGKRRSWLGWSERRAIKCAIKCAVKCAIKCAVKWAGTSSSTTTTAFPSPDSRWIVARAGVPSATPRLRVRRGEEELNFSHIAAFLPPRRALFSLLAGPQLSSKHRRG